MQTPFLYLLEIIIMILMDVLIDWQIKFIYYNSYLCVFVSFYNNLIIHGLYDDMC